MKPEFKAYRSSDDSALPRRDISSTNEPNSSTKSMSAGERHKLFRSYSDSDLRARLETNNMQSDASTLTTRPTKSESFSPHVDQGDPAQRESQEHQDLATRHESLRKDIQTYKIAHAYYELHKGDPNDPANGEYNHFAKTFNARQEEKFAKGALRLELITTSPDSGSSSPNNPDLHRNVNAADQNSDSAGSDRLLKETEVPSSTERQQEKSSYNYWTLRRLSRLSSSLITGITLSDMYKTMGVAARAIPTDLSNNVDPFKDALGQESHSILAKMKRQYDGYGDYIGPTPFPTAKVVGPIVGVGVPLTAAAIIYYVYWRRKQVQIQRDNREPQGAGQQNPGGAPGAYNLGAYNPAAQFNIPRVPVPAPAARFNVARVPVPAAQFNVAPVAAVAPIDPNAPPPAYQAQA